MSPMDFEEFLWATDDTVSYEAIKDAFIKRKPLGDSIHRQLMNKFRTYMVVGGMPQAVDAYIAGKDFTQIDFVKRNILSLYEGGSIQIRFRKQSASFHHFSYDSRATGKTKIRILNFH